MTFTITQTDQERFWSKVDRTGNGCWPWTASLTVWGYGQFLVRIAGVTYAAIAQKYGVSPATISLIKSGKVRGRI